MSESKEEEEYIVLSKEHKARIKYKGDVPFCDKHGSLLEPTTVWICKKGGEIFRIYKRGKEQVIELLARLLKKYRPSNAIN